MDAEQQRGAGKALLRRILGERKTALIKTGEQLNFGRDPSAAAPALIKTKSLYFRSNFGRPNSINLGVFSSQRGGENIKKIKKVAEQENDPKR